MSPIRFLSIPVAVAVTVFGFAPPVCAADEAMPAFTAPTVVENFRGCATCNSAAASCSTCGKMRGHFPSGIFHKSHTPHQTTLCPGACFGYFQTQWHRWENVCPIPYQGVNQLETPNRTAPPAPPAVLPKTGSDVPLPKVPSIPGM